MVVLSVCQVLGFGDIDIHGKAKTPASCGPTFCSRHHAANRSASLYQVVKKYNAGLGNCEWWCSFFKGHSEVFSDEVIFEQGLRAEAGGWLGGRYSDPGEAWWWLDGVNRM